MFSVMPVGVEVDRAGRRIEHHVLEHGAEHLGRGVDLGLGLGAQPDHLGVAAALEVEDAAVAPAVLVVADELAGGVGRERGLAGAGEAEEDRPCRPSGPTLAEQCIGNTPCAGSR